MKGCCFEKGIDRLIAGGFLPACAKTVKYEHFIENGFEIEKCEDEAIIRYGSPRGLFHALGILCSKKEKIFSYRKKFPSKDLGYLVDCSRNAVLKVGTAKRLIDILALSGYTYIEFYTEDTYAVEGEEYFGYQRGRYSAEEFRELIAYAGDYGMEVVPCIETLAHLDCLFKWDAYSDIHDIKDVLLCGEEKTYELIEKMIAFCRDTFISEKINIGGDEAHLAGLGKYLDKFGYRDRFEILSAHLKKVTDICLKYGFRPLSWGDMFFRSAFGSYLQSEYREFPKRIKKAVPKELGLMHWDYYNTEENNYKIMIDMFEQLGGKLSVFATGAWKWKGFVPGYGLSEKSAISALKVCAKKKIENLLVTGWGDDGAEAAQFSAIGCIILFGTADASGELSFLEADGLCRLCTGYNYRELKILEIPDMTYSGEAMIVNPSKYILYNDILVGLFDRHIEKNYGEFYDECERVLIELARRDERFSYLFETLGILSGALAQKCRISVDLRKCYLEKNREGLICVNKKIESLIEKEKTLIQKLRSQWETENKSFGFDVIALRLGGQLCACKIARDKIEEYLNGTIVAIEELETDRIPYIKNIPSVWPEPNIFVNKWSEMVSVNNL